MKILNWQQSRLIILGCCSFTILVALMLLFNKSDKYAFPQNIALEKWELMNNGKIKFNNKQIEGIKYQQDKNHNLDINIYHIPNYITNDSEDNSKLIR